MENLTVSGEITIDKTTVQHLLIAADMLQLRELVTGCGEFLRRELHPSNALGIFRFVLFLKFVHYLQTNLMMLSEFQKKIR